MRLYFFHNLIFESEIDLYGFIQPLNTIKAVPDVTIKIADYPFEELLCKIKAGTYCEHSLTRSWFYCYAGIFIIENGNTILVSPSYDYAKTSNIAIDTVLSGFITGWAMAFLLYQRGFTGLHSSALTLGNGAILIAGQSGAGKTTISLQLQNKGFKYLTDDITYVSPSDGFIVHPGLPVQKICRDISSNITDKSSLIYADSQKDKYAIINTEHHCQIPQELKFLFFMEKKQVDQLIFQELYGFEKLPIIISALYMKNLYTKTHFPPEEKCRCLKLASTIRVIKIQRPENQDTVTEIIKNILLTI